MAFFMRRIFPLDQSVDRGDTFVWTQGIFYQGIRHWIFGFLLRIRLCQTGFFSGLGSWNPEEGKFFPRPFNTIRAQGKTAKLGWDWPLPLVLERGLLKENTGLCAKVFSALPGEFWVWVHRGGRTNSLLSGVKINGRCVLLAGAYHNL